MLGAGHEPQGEERLAPAPHDGVDEDGTAVELVEGLDGPVVVVVLARVLLDDLEVMVRTLEVFRGDFEPVRIGGNACFPKEKTFDS